MGMRVVVVGGVALGPKVAARCKRLDPEATVTMIDQSTRISYGGCGIPYFISGEVQHIEELQSTPYGIVRDAAFFKESKGVDVLLETRAIAIDRKAKTVTVLDLKTNQTSTLPYDKLVLAVGSSPNRLPIPGIDLAGISPATNLDEAELIKKAVESRTINNAVVVGGGFIGLEMAVAFADMWDIPTTIVEVADQILSGFLSPTMARMATHDLETHNVKVLTTEKVTRFEGKDGHVTKVITDKREIPADFVVMSAGVKPNTQLAVDAGLEANERGLLIVNEFMQTSDPDIYAGGDCAMVKNLITGKKHWFPLGSMANRQGRVIGSNLAGKGRKFSGAVGAWGVKLFEQSVSGAGFTLPGAMREGYDAITVHIEQVDRAHFYPEHAMMTLELVVDRPTRRVLGVQGMSPLGDALMARINPVAVLLGHHITVEEISNLEIVYSPPFASSMDIVNVVGNVADNILEGRCQPVDPQEFEKLWHERAKNDVYFLDARLSRGPASELAEKYPNEWHNLPTEELKEHLGKLPKDSPIVIVCNTGLRAYEAQLVFNEAGFKNTKTVAGGMQSVSRLGVKL